MLYTQWNYDEAVSVEREEAYEDGREAGKAEGIAKGKAEGIVLNLRQIIYDFLGQLGEIPENIRHDIADEQDEAVLRKWCMAAPGAKSFEEFRASMKALDKPCHQTGDL